MIKIFKNSFFYTLGEFLKNTAAFLLVPIYTRFLTPNDYGIVAMVSAVVAFISTFLMMGQSEAIIRFYFDLKKEEEKKTCVSTILFFCAAVFLLFALLTSFFGGRYFNILFPSMPFKPYGLILCWTVFFSIFELFAFNVLKTEEKALKFSIFNLFGFIANSFLIILLIVRFRLGAFGKTFADLLYAAIASFFFIYLIKWYIVPRFSFGLLKKTLRFGVPLIPHQLSLWVINLSDRYCLQLLGSLSMVGLYSIGYSVALPINLFSSSIGMAWTPSFFKTAHESDAKIRFARMTTYYVLMVMFCALAIAMFGYEIILILTTKNYYASASVIPVVALAYFFHALYKVATRILAYSKQTARLSLCTMVAAIINIILNVLWIPKLGMMGAAWATLISFVVLFFSSHIYTRLYYNVPFEYGRIVIIFLSAMGIYFLSMLLARHNLTLIGVALKIALLFAYVIIFYKSGFFEPEEKRKIKQLLLGRFLSGRENL